MKLKRHLRSFISGRNLNALGKFESQRDVEGELVRRKYVNFINRETLKNQNIEVFQFVLPIELMAGLIEIKLFLLDLSTSALE
jgi:hypothetical protein